MQEHIREKSEVATMTTEGSTSRRGWEIRLKRKDKVKLWKSVFNCLRSLGMQPPHTAYRMPSSLGVCVASCIGHSVTLGVLGNLSQSQVPHL